LRHTETSGYRDVLSVKQTQVVRRTGPHLASDWSSLKFNQNEHKNRKQHFYLDVVFCC